MAEGLRYILINREEGWERYLDYDASSGKYGWCKKPEDAFRFDNFLHIASALHRWALEHRGAVPGDKLFHPHIARYWGCEIVILGVRDDGGNHAGSG